MSVSNEADKRFSVEEIREAIRAEQEPDLEPCLVAEAIEDFIDEKSDSCVGSTLDQYRTSLGYFEQWCRANGIENLNDLSAKHLQEYKRWRRNDGNDKIGSLNKSTMDSEMDRLGNFIRVCETFNVVKPGLYEAVPTIDLKKGDDVRDDKLDTERAKQILDYLSEFKYASREHVVLVIGTETGARVSGIHSLDIEDYCGDGDIRYLKFRHRPDTGTKLKNGVGGHRKVALRPSACKVLDDYIENHRDSREDEFGRNPLITSQKGRLGKSTLRKYVYKWTRPCAIGDLCPHDRDTRECVATDNDRAYACPSSQSSHTIRRGYITHELRCEVDRFTLSGRVDASPEVIKQHYDARTESEEMRVRRRVIEVAELNHETYGRK